MLAKPPLIGKNRRISPQDQYEYHQPQRIAPQPGYPQQRYPPRRYDDDYSDQGRRRNVPVNPAYGALYRDSDSDDSLRPADRKLPSGFDISDNLEPTNMNYIARQTVEKRNRGRWFRLLRAFHYRGQLSLNEVALLKDSTFG